MMDPHIGEDAELYALGTLGEDERERIDVHLGECAQCRRRVGEAEDTLLALEREHGLPAVAAPPLLLPVRKARTFPLRALATAAAVAAAFFVGWMIPRGIATPESPQVAMLHSHFNHAQFVGSGPTAKVLYARDRHWYYVLIDAQRTYDVVGVFGSQSTPLGRTQAHGETSELFVDRTAHYDRIELRDGNFTLETAQIR